MIFQTFCMQPTDYVYLFRVIFTKKNSYKFSEQQKAAVYRNEHLLYPVSYELKLQHYLKDFQPSVGCEHNETFI